MTPIQIIFIVVSVVTLYSAVMVVTRHNLVHSALFLVLAFFAMAVYFVLLDAGYIAVVQILVNIGAIAIMMITAVMFTQQVTDEDAPFSKYKAYGFGAAFLVFASLVVMLSDWAPIKLIAPEADTSAVVSDLGYAFFTANNFVIPTIIASILLLAALIGAISVAWKRQQAED
ncbi:MAG: NADH-quinone oxidoreductase subunit J [Chloroflexota bacterium]